MIRVTVWVERVQVSYLASETFQSIEEAQEWIDEDFVTRSKDRDFMCNGGYEVEEQVWKRLPSPKIVKTPSIQWET